MNGGGLVHRIGDDGDIVAGVVGADETDDAPGRDRFQVEIEDEAGLPRHGKGGLPGSGGSPRPVRRPDRAGGWWRVRPGRDPPPARLPRWSGPACRHAAGRGCRRRSRGHRPRRRARRVRPVGAGSRAHFPDNPAPARRGVRRAWSRRPRADRSADGRVQRPVRRRRGRRPVGRQGANRQREGRTGGERGGGSWRLFPGWADGPATGLYP